MLVTVELADAGTKTGAHRVLVVGGCGDMTAPGNIGISLEEAKTLLSALQWEFVAAQAAEITERAGVNNVVLASTSRTGSGVKFTLYSVACCCQVRDSCHALAMANRHARCHR